MIFHLHNDEVEEAYQLIKDIEPVTPQEYILKGVVNASIGQMTGSRDHVKMAQQYFQLVGGSASECDTIPGLSRVTNGSCAVGSASGALAFWPLLQTLLRGYNQIEPAFAMLQSVCYRAALLHCCCASALHASTMQRQLRAHCVPATRQAVSVVVPQDPVYV